MRGFALILSSNCSYNRTQYSAGSSTPVSLIGATRTESGVLSAPQEAAFVLGRGFILAVSLR